MSSRFYIERIFLIFFPLIVKFCLAVFRNRTRLVLWFSRRRIFIVFLVDDILVAIVRVVCIYTRTVNEKQQVLVNFYTPWSESCSCHRVKNFAGYLTPSPLRQRYRNLFLSVALAVSCGVKRDEMASVSVVVFLRADVWRDVWMVGVWRNFAEILRMFSNDGFVEQPSLSLS